MPMPNRTKHNAAHILVAIPILSFPKLFTCSGREYTLSKGLEKVALSGWYLGKLITTMEVLAMMGKVYFRGERIVDRKTNMLSNIYMVLSIVFLLLIFPGIIVFMTFAALPLSAPLYSMLCAGIGIALIASLLLLNKKSRVEVMDDGLNLGGRLIL